MNIDLSIPEASLLIEILNDYKKKHPLNIQECKICNDLYLKILDSVYPTSQKETKLRKD